jgi:hypothetical protein
MKKNCEREKKKCMRCSENSKRELGSDEIAMFLTLPWKMC